MWPKHATCSALRPPRASTTYWTRSSRGSPTRLPPGAYNTSVRWHNGHLAGVGCGGNQSVSPQRRTDRDMLRRTLSQNFLRPTGADQFVGLTPADATSLAIEVGAGEGVLTERLAHRYEHVISYEVDEHVAARLTKRVRRLPNVQVVVADFLASRPPEEPFEIVSSTAPASTRPADRPARRASGAGAATAGRAPRWSRAAAGRRSPASRQDRRRQRTRWTARGSQSRPGRPAAWPIHAR